jgi:hypothetical protein
MILLNPSWEYRYYCVSSHLHGLLRGKVRHDQAMIPFGCPHWFRCTYDWIFWRKAHTTNALKLKEAVNAYFKLILEERSFPLAYPAVLVSRYHAYNLFNGKAIANYLSAMLWGAVSLGRDFSNDDYLQFFARSMLDLILQRCNKEVAADLAYNSYAAPTPGTWGVPSIVTRKRTICDRQSDNI